MRQLSCGAISHSVSTFLFHMTHLTLFPCLLFSKGFLHLARSLCQPKYEAEQLSPLCLAQGSEHLDGSADSSLSCSTEDVP